MSCIRRLVRLRQTVVVNSTNLAFFPATDWMAVTSMNEADFLLNLLSIDGQGEVKPGVQLATVRTDKASTPVAITNGAYTSSVGFTQYREAISASGSAFIRFGFVGKIKTGQTGQSTMEVELTLAVDDCGAVLGGKELSVQPYMTGTDDANTNIDLVTGWSPTLRVDKLKLLALVFDNANDAFEYQFKVRSCKDRMVPNGWVSLTGTTWVNPATGSSEANSGEIAIPAGANFSTNSFFQVGIGLRRRSAGTWNPRCMLTVQVHVKYV